MGFKYYKCIKTQYKKYVPSLDSQWSLFGMRMNCFLMKARLALCFISNLSLINQQYETRHFHE